MSCKKEEFGCVCVKAITHPSGQPLIIFFGKELKADLISQHLASWENMEIAEILFEKGHSENRCDTVYCVV